MVEDHKDDQLCLDLYQVCWKVKVAAKIIIVHYPNQAFWREAAPFDFENATAKDNEPVDQELYEDIFDNVCQTISENHGHLMVRLIKTSIVNV